MPAGKLHASSCEQDRFQYALKKKSVISPRNQVTGLIIFARALHIVLAKEEEEEGPGLCRLPQLKPAEKLVEANNGIKYSGALVPASSYRRAEIKPQDWVETPSILLIRLHCLEATPFEPRINAAIFQCMTWNIWRRTPVRFAFEMGSHAWPPSYAISRRKRQSSAGFALPGGAHHPSAGFTLTTRTGTDTAPKAGTPVLGTSAGG
ncbi:unnamed protein product [Calicophoron daubneyi]|uniref:Uncharacterized protein n=1 Tax=Calicophoron daubneyi TaxID=300641 RepID=A0AAV2TR99_CALDB